ncbi:thermonuclease family protein [Citrobacter braakii]
MPRLIFLFLLILAPSVQASLTGRVVRVIDGDTVVVLAAPATEVRIRLSGIDAPEKGQPFGQRARQYFSSRVAGRGGKWPETAGTTTTGFSVRCGLTAGISMLNWSVAAWPGHTVSITWHKIRHT